MASLDVPTFRIRACRPQPLTLLRHVYSWSYEKSRVVTRKLLTPWHDGSREMLRSMSHMFLLLCPDREMNKSKLGRRAMTASVLSRRRGKALYLKPIMLKKRHIGKKDQSSWSGEKREVGRLLFLVLSSPDFLDLN